MNEVTDAYAILTELVSTDLQNEFLAGRIKNTEYADTYQKLMNTALNLAYDTPQRTEQSELNDAIIDIKKKELEILEQELLLKECENTKCAAQTALIEAQTDVQVLQLDVMEQQILVYEQDVLVKQQDVLVKEQDVLNKQQDILNKEQAILNQEQDVLTKQAQTDLYVRQTDGFDDDLRRKMLDTQMNTWAMMFSSGLLEEKPAMICDDAVTDLYAYMSDQVGVPYNPGTCPSSINTVAKADAKLAELGILRTELLAACTTS